MLNIYCDIKKDGNHLMFVPGEKFSLEYNFLYNKDHVCNATNTNNLIDIRNYLVNNYINSNIYFYAVLYDSLNLPIQLSNISGTSTICSYRRDKTKLNRKTVLQYSIDESETFNTQILNFENRELLNLGHSKFLKFRDIAYEASGCFNPIISNSGDGFVGINLITTTDISPKYAILIAFPSRAPNSLSEGDSDDESVNGELYEDSYELPQALEYGVEPTAPPAYADVIVTPEPSAPDLSNDPACVEVVYAYPIDRV